MNAKDFLDLMGEIDGDLIVNAKQPVAPRRAPAWRKLTVIAAAACLLVGVLSALVLIGMQQNDSDDLPMDTEAAIESPNEDAQPEQGETVVEAETLEETTTPTPNIAIGAFLKTFSALQYGASEASGLPSDHKNNFSYNEHDYQDESVNLTLKVNMQGTEYELTYEESSDGPLYHDTIHKYSDGVREQWINGDTGECISFYNPCKYDDKIEILPNDKQKEIALAFLKEKVANSEEFQVTRENHTSGILIIWFARMNNGIETYEKVSVWVDQTGYICRYKLEHIDEMSNVQPLPEEIIQSANIALENEVQSIYRQLAEQEDYEMTYKAEIEKLVRLDDGRLAFDCHVEVKVTTPDGEILTEGAWFIIPITEPTIQTE